MSDGKALTIFEPSDNQRAVLSALQDDDYGCSIVSACQAAGISKQAYYLWFDNPAFGEWWEEQANRFFRRQLARVQRATMISATEADAPGSPQAQKLFFERFDKDYVPASRQHQEHSGSVGVALDMSGMEPDEIERLAHAVDDDPPADPGLPDTANGADPAPGPVGAGAP